MLDKTKMTFVDPAFNLNWQNLANCVRYAQAMSNQHQIDLTIVSNNGNGFSILHTANEAQLLRGREIELRVNPLRITLIPSLITTRKGE